MEASSYVPVACQRFVACSTGWINVRGIIVCTSCVLAGLSQNGWQEAKLRAFLGRVGRAGVTAHSYLLAHEIMLDRPALTSLMKTTRVSQRASQELELLVRFGQGVGASDTLVTFLGIPPETFGMYQTKLNTEQFIGTKSNGRSHKKRLPRTKHKNILALRIERSNTRVTR